MLRQVTVRPPTSGRVHASGRGFTRTNILVLVVALLIGAAAGTFGGHAFWKGSGTPSAKDATSTLNAATAALFQQAYTLQKAGKLADAQADYLEIVKQNPVNYYAYYDLGLIYQQTNHDGAATVDYEKALLIEPNYEPALYNLATIESSSNPNGAIDLYLQLQALRPKNGDAVAFNLGLLYLQTGNTKQGVAELRYAIKLTPSLASRVPAKYQRLLSASKTPA